MPTERICLIGSGGHALVVLDSLGALGVPAESIWVLDQSADRAGRQVAGHTVRSLDISQLSGLRVQVCIGDNGVRARISALLDEAGCMPHSVVDPRAIVSPRSSIGPGSFVAPGAIIASDASIGRGCIINHGAIVDHECMLADFVHIAPGATLAGAVALGRECFIGAGANILPRCLVAAHSIIGAGAVLIRDASEPGVYVGVPARKV